MVKEPEIRSLWEHLKKPLFFFSCIHILLHRKDHTCLLFYFLILIWPHPVPLRGEGNGNPSSTLGWKIPWTEEPGGLQSMGSLRVGHD